MNRTHYHQAISEIVATIVMDRRDSITANELGSSAYGISVNNMIGRFNELDRLQDIARSAEEDREKALSLAAENKELRDQIATLKKQNLAAHSESGERNYKMENVALRALQQQSNKTIAMLQEKLREKTDVTENYDDPATLANIATATSTPIVVGDAWKLSGRKTDKPLYPVTQQQMPGVDQVQQYPQQQNDNFNIGPGGFIMPGQGPPPSSPLSYHNHPSQKQRPTHYLPQLEDANKKPFEPTQPDTATDEDKPENDTSANANIPPPPPPPPQRKLSIDIEQFNIVLLNIF